MGLSDVLGARYGAVFAGRMADAGGAAEQLWLLGGVALALLAAGVVALAAARGAGRGRHDD
jgi:hypothetical protein